MNYMAETTWENYDPEKQADLTYLIYFRLSSKTLTSFLHLSSFIYYGYIDTEL